jgi:hypothetical protein
VTVRVQLTATVALAHVVNLNEGLTVHQGLIVSLGTLMRAVRHPAYGYNASNWETVGKAPCYQSANELQHSDGHWLQDYCWCIRYQAQGLHAADHHDSARHDPAGLECLELMRAQRSTLLCPALPRVRCVGRQSVMPSASKKS